MLMRVPDSRSQVGAVSSPDRQCVVRRNFTGELLIKAGNPSDPEFEAANVELEKIQEQKRRRTPQERHSLRQRAMYVDPLETGGWNRPIDLTKDASRDELIYAMNDYSLMRHNLDSAEKYNSVRECLTDWPGRPELPELRWPKVLDRNRLDARP